MTDLARAAAPAATPDPAPGVDRPAEGAEPAARRPRLAFLDGLRAVSALYVLAHHLYLTAYPGFPRTDAPAAFDLLAYGHFGVVVFIVLSGFSLALRPARHDFGLTTGYAAFMRRRAWRIVPPFWIALVLSELVMGVVVGDRAPGAATLRGFVVHGLLVQNIVEGASPNGAFWSIAIEWQLYFVFPVVLLALRRVGAAGTVVIGTVGTVAVGIAAATVDPLHPLLHTSPQMGALFVFGAVAVRATTTPRALVPWGWLAAGLIAVVAVGCAVAGPARVTDAFYGVDIVLGAGVACGLAALVRPGGAARRVRRVLESGPLVGIGHFSYSLYLVHAPVLVLASVFVLEPLDLPPATRFVLLAMASPVVVALGRGFFVVAERPFLRRAAGTRRP